MHPLMLHRTCDLGPIRAITGQIDATPGGFAAEFRIEGQVGAIELPPKRASQRADGLWRSTCLEVFWQPIGDTAYHEFNLAPSSNWAAYAFDSYREGMGALPVNAIALATSQDQAGFTLTAAIAADLAAPAQVGLSAVIKHPSGALQYWALAFPPGKPDFHSEACRTLVLDR